MFGRSFFAAAAMLSLVALPMVVANVREGLQAIPAHVREASYAVGKTKIATTRRVLLPAARPSVMTGSMLGLGRVIGDTAIVLLLLGGHAHVQSAGSMPMLGLLRGTGDTLTGYIYYNAPTGDGNQPAKAYAAAFVLMLMVLALNVGVDPSCAARKGGAMELRKPPPVRRLTGNEDAAGTRAAPARRQRQRHHGGRLVRRRPPAAAPASIAIDRMQVEEPVGQLRRQARRQVGLAPDPPGRGAGADRTVRMRQDDAAALAQPADRADPRRVLSGRITLDGVDIAAMEPTALRRRVTMVFQQPNPFPMSVFDNVAYVLREQASRRPKRAAVRGAVGTRWPVPACSTRSPTTSITRR